MAVLMDVQDWVLSLRTLPIDRFYPTAAAKATGLPLGTVMRELLYISQHDGWLKACYEIRCPECSYAKTVEVDDPTSLYEQTLDCLECGHETDIDADCIFPIFKVNSEWQASAKKAQAVSGQSHLSTGGSSSLAEIAASENGLNMISFLNPEQRSALEALRNLAISDPTLDKVQGLIEQLQKLPLDREQRGWWKGRLLDLLEVLDKAGDVVQKWQPILAPIATAIGASMIVARP